MWKNEKGFSLAEGLAAFSILLIVISLLFPVVFRMAIQLEKTMKETEAERLLFESIERNSLFDDLREHTSQEDQVKYTTFFLMDDRSGKACVKYEDTQKCIVTYS